MCKEHRTQTDQGGDPPYVPPQTTTHAPPKCRVPTAGIRRTCPFPNGPCALLDPKQEVTSSGAGCMSPKSQET